MAQDYNNTDFPCLVHLIEDLALTISNRFFVYVSLFCILIGLVGNALSMLVFLSPDMRTISSNIYLLVLSVSDSAYLISVFLSKILTNLRCLYFTESHLDVENKSDVMCQLLQYLMDLFADYSTCLILAFTFERYVACYHALKFRESRSTLRARIFCVAMLVLIAVTITPHHLLYVGLEQRQCAVLPQFEHTFTLLYSVEVSLFRILPVVIIATLNVFICIKVWQLHRNRPVRKALEMKCLTKTGQATEQRKNTTDERHIQITIMLVVVSTSYVILYFPAMLHFILWKVIRSDGSFNAYVTLLMCENVTSTLHIAGFAINFFLYTVSCKSFREQLILVLNKRTRHQTSVLRSKRDMTSGANVHNGITDHDNQKTSQTQV